MTHGTVFIRTSFDEYMHICNVTLQPQFPNCGKSIDQARAIAEKVIKQVMTFHSLTHPSTTTACGVGTVAGSLWATNIEGDHSRTGWFSQPIRVALDWPARVYSRVLLAVGRYLPRGFLCLSARQPCLCPQETCVDCGESAFPSTPPNEQLTAYMEVF